MRNLTYCVLCVILYFNAASQTALTAYTFTNTTPVQSTNSTTGWNSSGNFSSSYTYSNRYGQRSSGSAVERTITGFSIGALSYSRIPSAGGRPFEIVRVKRHPSVAGSIVNMLYEHTAVSPTASGTHYYEPGYDGSLPSVMNSFVVNRGSDNTFSNSASTAANIERIDLIKTSGIAVTQPAKQGFLINERNGNDNFKVAAITSKTAGNEVSGLGTLLQITTASWGKVGPNILSMVMSRDTVTDPFLRPKTEIASQQISGVFISFQSLGLTAGSTVYGLSIFPDDVTSAMDLVGLTNVPTNTSEASTGGGGMDMMAGSGYFVENSILPVHGLEFEAIPTERVIQLKWNTKSEFNNEFFEVQKLNAYQEWVTLSKERAGPQGMANSYQLIDHSPSLGINQYRLKQVDISGDFSYSRVVAVNFSSRNGFSLYPNPARDYIIVSGLDRWIGQKIEIQIISSEGRMVVNQSNILAQHHHKIQLGQLTKGWYALQVVAGDQQFNIGQFTKE